VDSRLPPLRIISRLGKVRDPRDKAGRAAQTTAVETGGDGWILGLAPARV